MLVHQRQSPPFSLDEQHRTCVNKIEQYFQRKNSHKYGHTWNACVHGICQVRHHCRLSHIQWYEKVMCNRNFPWISCEWKYWNSFATNQSQHFADNLNGRCRPRHWPVIHATCDHTNSFQPTKPEKCSSTDIVLNNKKKNTPHNPFSTTTGNLDLIVSVCVCARALGNLPWEKHPQTNRLIF